MNLFELTPGYYKIRKKQYQDGRKHTNNNTIYLLKVEGADEKL